MLNIGRGKLLISEPKLIEEAFFKSVILLTHHDNSESIGLILNQPSKIKLNEVFDVIKNDTFKFFIGGPVGKNSIQYIHKLGSRISRSKEILDGLYWGGDFNEITRLINNNKISEDQIRFFIGYSGWEAFQLQKEIKEKSWIISQTTSEECLAYSDANFWSKLIKKQGNKYKIWANLPRNPNLN